MKHLNTKWKVFLYIVFFALIVGIYLIYSHQIPSDNQAKKLYAECHDKYMSKYNKLTEGIDGTNVHDKVPLLYNDANKALIEEMGDLINEYDDKLVRYEDYYVTYFNFKQLYENLKKHFYELEKWDELSYIEQVKISASFILSDY